MHTRHARDGGHNSWTHHIGCQSSGNPQPLSLPGAGRHHRRPPLCNMAFRRARGSVSCPCLRSDAMIRLVIDMNLSPAWATELRNHSVEAIHWSEIGSPTAPDIEIMAWARTHGYMVLTHDLDFGALLAATGNTGPSVIQLRAEDVRPTNMVAMVVSAIQTNSEDLLRGALITIHPKRMRTRVLPLRSSS